MRILAYILVVMVWGSCGVSAQETAPARTQAGAEHFVVMDVLVETGQQPLAAYQIELATTNAAGQVKIVGIEGGDPTPFRTAPYYDPAALKGGRVILGGFSTAPVEQLPRGSVRIASVHCLVTGDLHPAFQTKISAAATGGGQSIHVQANVKERNQ